MRHLSSALEVVGLLALSAGALLISIPLGLAVAGASCVALGIALDRSIK